MLVEIKLRSILLRVIIYLFVFFTLSVLFFGVNEFMTDNKHY